MPGLHDAVHPRLKCRRHVHRAEAGLNLPRLHAPCGFVENWMMPDLVFWSRVPYTIARPNGMLPPNPATVAVWIPSDATEW